MSSPTPPPDWFSTTHWSQVRAAGKDDTHLALEALEKLCHAYWPPLYGYVRRRGHSEHEAQDLTQEFFARLLARKDFAGLDPARGKFRAFLLASMNHFLAKEWRRDGAQKRGAGATVLSLDGQRPEEVYAAARLTDCAADSPECAFDREWAHLILERSSRRLREDFVGHRREALFREINVFLSSMADAGDYAAIGVRLGMTPAAVAKSVERLRRSYRDIVRDEIAQTVLTPEELEEELSHLLEILRRDLVKIEPAAVIDSGKPV